MTPDEWEACQSPKRTLSRLRAADPRELRRFAIACCRRILHLLPDPRSQRLIEVAERYNEGQASEAEFQAAYEAACRVYPDASDEATAARRRLVWHQPGEKWEWGGAFDAAERAANAVMGLVPESVEDQRVAWRSWASAQCNLLGLPLLTGRMDEFIGLHGRASHPSRRFGRCL